MLDLGDTPFGMPLNGESELPGALHTDGLHRAIIGDCLDFELGRDLVDRLTVQGIHLQALGAAH